MCNPRGHNSETRAPQGGGKITPPRGWFHGRFFRFSSLVCRQPNWHLDPHTALWCMEVSQQWRKGSGCRGWRMSCNVWCMGWHCWCSTHRRQGRVNRGGMEEGTSWWERIGCEWKEKKMWGIWEKKQNVKEMDYRGKLEKSILIYVISYHLKNDHQIYLYIYIMTVLLWKVFQELLIASATQRNNC